MFALFHISRNYISSSQILTRSSSIGSTSYPDSSNATQRETSRSKLGHSMSVNSSSSSVLSIKNQRNALKSSLSIHSKAQETVDTAPFTIDSPRPPSIKRRQSHDNQSIRAVTDRTLPKLSRVSSKRPTPDSDPEKKVIHNE